MDPVTARYLRILRLIRWSHVSPLAGDIEQEAARVDNRRRIVWKVRVLHFFGPWLGLLLRLEQITRTKNPFRKPSNRKKKKQQLDIDQMNEIEIVKPLKPQEKQNGVYEKQNG